MANNVESYRKGSISERVASIVRRGNSYRGSDEPASYRNGEVRREKKGVKPVVAAGLVAGALLVGAAGVIGYNEWQESREKPVVSAPVGTETPESKILFEMNGRIWQPDIKNGNAPYERSFTAPESGAYIFNGVNAQLWKDKNKDGIPDEKLAAADNGIRVQLNQGDWLKVKGGANNGGFDLTPVKK